MTDTGPVDAVVQRAAAGGGSTAPPVPPPAADPKADPKFTAVTSTVKTSAQKLKKHAPPSQEVGKAQAAAKGPSDDKAGQAKAAQIEKMAAAKPKGFDKAAFIAAVKTAIASGRAEEPRRGGQVRRRPARRTASRAR